MPRALDPDSIIARERRANRDAQRDVRRRRVEAGRPDPATLDRAICDAIRDCLAAAPQGRRFAHPLEPARILRAAAVHLLRRSVKAIEQGKPPLVYRADAVAEALADRLGLEV